MTKQRMTIIKEHNYANGSDEALAYEQGWCDGYDSNEEVWAKQVLPIVGELEEHIRYDWENNDCLQVAKIKMIFDVFWQYAPEHDWLGALVKDAVAAYEEHKWDDLSAGDLEDLRFMADKFGVSMLGKWRVTVTWTDVIEVEAVDHDEACQQASNKFIDEFSIYDIAHHAEFDAEEDND
jgi:hypothetical protein